ncbi:hypothetical protein KI387_043212, partial [Taxus chinensis]
SVEVVISVFDVEGIDVRGVGICMDIDGDEIDAKDESDVIDWGMIDVDEVK